VRDLSRISSHAGQSGGLVPDTFRIRPSSSSRVTTGGSLNPESLPVLSMGPWYVEMKYARHRARTGRVNPPSPIQCASGISPVQNAPRSSREVRLVRYMSIGSNMYKRGPVRPLDSSSCDLSRNALACISAIACLHICYRTGSPGSSLASGQRGPCTVPDRASWRWQGGRHGGCLT
jgi:hypothetical protein